MRVVRVRVYCVRMLLACVGCVFGKFPFRSIQTIFSLGSRCSTGCRSNEGDIFPFHCFLYRHRFWRKYAIGINSFIDCWLLLICLEDATKFSDGYCAKEDYSGGSDDY